jgi:hypothetical protein
VKIKTNGKGKIRNKLGIYVYVICNSVKKSGKGRADLGVLDLAALTSLDVFDEPLLYVIKPFSALSTRS